MIVEALRMFDALIQYQYTGSRAAMTAMHDAAQAGKKALDEYDAQRERHAQEWRERESGEQPAAQQEREQFHALVDDLLAASENDETESARQKAHEWFDGLHRAQPAAQPLSDEQIKAIWWQCEAKTRDTDPRHVWWALFARAIERAHGIGKDAP